MYDYEVLMCYECYRDWTRKVVRGPKPRLCPSCRGHLRPPPVRRQKTRAIGGLELTDGGRKEAGIAETNDCTVRAMAVACDVPYAEAHSFMSKSGRKKGKGVVFWYVLSQNGNHCLGKKFEGQNVVSAKGLRAFLARNPWAKKGTYVLHMTRHVAVLKDGKLVDSFDSSRKVIDGAWRVTPA